MRFRIALLIIATGLGNFLAIAQNGTPQNAQAAFAASCPLPADLTPQHLYGTWLAQLEGETGTVTVRLGRHPEFAGSVSGTLERTGPSGTERAQVAGDVDEGDFTLEESSDGKRISATWIGQVVDASCGKEIKGTWTKENDTSPNAARSFTLRKQAGWQ